MSKHMNGIKHMDKQVRGELDRVEERQPRGRIPFGIPRAKLAVMGEIPGYEIAWINDIGGRIDEAVAGGFEFVSRKEIHLAVGAEVTPSNSDLGDRISMVVGSIKQTGAPLRAYLMKLKKEYADENRQILKDRREQRMKSIERGKASPLGENFYVPSHTPIKFSK